MRYSSSTSPEETDEHTRRQVTNFLLGIKLFMPQHRIPIVLLHTPTLPRLGALHQSVVGDHQRLSRRQLSDPEDGQRVHLGDDRKVVLQFFAGLAGGLFLDVEHGVDREWRTDGHPGQRISSAQQFEMMKL